MTDQRPRAASHIIAYRAAAGLTQVQLAGVARTTARAVRQAERGDIMGMTLGTLLRISSALECGAADLFPVLGAVRSDD